MNASKSGVNKNMSSLILSGAESIVAGWKLKTDGVDSQQVFLGRRSCRGSVRDADRACHVCSEDRAKSASCGFYAPLNVDYKSILVQIKVSVNSFLNIAVEQKCPGTM